MAPPWEQSSFVTIKKKPAEAGDGDEQMKVCCSTLLSYGCLFGQGQKINMISWWGGFLMMWRKTTGFGFAEDLPISHIHVRKCNCSSLFRPLNGSWLFAKLAVEMTEHDRRGSILWWFCNSRDTEDHDMDSVVAIFNFQTKTQQLLEYWKGNKVYCRQK